MAAPEKGYAEQLRDTLDASAKEFERQFLAHTAYQNPAYWSLFMGKVMTDLRDAAATFTQDSVSPENVRMTIGLAATLAVVADFYTQRFGKDVEPPAGDLNELDLGEEEIDGWDL